MEMYKMIIPARGAKRIQARVDIIAELGREYDDALRIKSMDLKIKKLRLVKRKYKKAKMPLLAQRVDRDLEKLTTLHH